VSDALLYITDRKEALSRAYAAAVAAGAGYTTSPPSDFDRDSIDVTFEAGGHMRPRISAQLKSTTNLKLDNEVFTYILKKKNYDDLRIETQVPRILVVLRLPKSESEWLNISAEELVIRRAAYWVSLRDKPEVPNEDSVTVYIPMENMFDIACLRDLMEKARDGPQL
jgi:hypothetical protein